MNNKVKPRSECPKLAILSDASIRDESDGEGGGSVTKTTKPKRSRDIEHFRATYRGCITSAASSESTTEELASNLLKLKKRFNVPRWAWTEMHTWRDACVAMFHYCPGKLVYCVEWDGKPIHCEWDDLPEACRVAFRNSEPIITGHYWQRKDGTIGKPFYNSLGSNVTEQTPHVASKEVAP